MNNEEMIANKLGFESAEEMEKYYDLCWAEFYPEAILAKRITKSQAVESVKRNEWEHLLNVDREERLFAMADFQFDGLIESMRAGDERCEQSFRDKMEYLLSEAKKCISNKHAKKM